MAKKAKKHNYSKGWETRRRNAALRANGAAVKENVAARAMISAETAQSSAPQPESEFAIKARAIVIAARKRGGEQAVKDALERVAMQASYDARMKQGDHHLAHVKAIHEANAINIVAAFMAEIEGIGALHRGPLPPVIMVSGLTIARVTDALAQAGYSKHGFKQPDRRDEIMSRSHPVGPETAC